MRVNIDLLYGKNYCSLRFAGLLFHAFYFWIISSNVLRLMSLDFERGTLTKDWVLTILSVSFRTSLNCITTMSSLIFFRSGFSSPKVFV